ncbi:hypothetical protein [Actinacidiphila acididurans]|uniref:Uncharacterized protein n=1 Tax=Actinacidiphila acididurans TaxID=2784346 RepID=A0ABS2TLU1_9ACTN|nr:hypothetical protein [Actinacidiphila acididurans]MBM9502958.1 hypothetical protein [Actinacidiphila acididurans]
MRGHRSVRPGFHWQPPWALSEAVVYAPAPWDVPATEAAVNRPGGVHGPHGVAEAGFSGTGDPLFTETARRLGRDGRTPVEHLDVLLTLDALSPSTAPRIGLPSGELLAGAGAYGKTPLLYGCTAHSGGLALDDDGERITWEPGTTVLVEDLPRTSVDALPRASYAMVRSSDADPADALRREAFVLLGTRYHSDVPPVPEDARPAESTWQDSRSHARVPTEYPGLADNAEVFLDEARATLLVRRFGFDGGGTEYALPLTRERSVLVDAMRREYLHSAAAYASVGADREAADTLRDTPWSPEALRRLLAVMSVATAADAARLIARSPDEWRRVGWPVDAAVDDAASTLRNAEPRQSWRVSQAAALASAGIAAERAYELRSAGFTSVQAAISADATRPTAAAGKAKALIEASETPVPASIAAALGTAREHSAEDARTWGQDHRKSCALEGWGLWVTLTRHTFTLRNGSVRTLWDVTNGWWAINDESEGEDGQSSCVFTDEDEALAAWRATRSELKAYEAQLLE